MQETETACTRTLSGLQRVAPEWVSTHQRLVGTILASIVGVYQILVGISKL